MEARIATLLQLDRLVLKDLAVALGIQPLDEEDVLGVAEEFVSHAFFSHLMVGLGLLKDVFEEVDAASLQLLVSHHAA